MTDDDKLMVRVQEGDSAAFDELVARYQGPLLGFFFRNIRDRQLSEDFAQETLLRVYNQAWDYLPTGRFRGWIYRIAHNLMIDNIRRQSHDALVHAYTGSHDGGIEAVHRIAAQLVPPEEITDQRELARIVDDLLKELPDEQRLTFTMHYFSGLPLSEVAAAMETSLPTCKSRLRLCREKLRHKLRARGFGDPSEAESVADESFADPTGHHAG